MVKQTQAIRQHKVDKLFEWVWPFCGVSAQRINNHEHVYLILIVTGTMQCWARRQKSKFSLQWRIPTVWETGIPVGTTKLWRPINTFQVFFFQLYLNEKFVKWRLMISQCILFWNGLEYKNADRREKQWDKAVVVKERTVNETVFIHVTT